jgi:hypothetical protein
MAKAVTREKVRGLELHLTLSEPALVLESSRIVSAKHGAIAGLNQSQRVRPLAQYPNVFG